MSTLAKPWLEEIDELHPWTCECRPDDEDDSEIMIVVLDSILSLLELDDEGAEKDMLDGSDELQQFVCIKLTDNMDGFHLPHSSLH